MSQTETKSGARTAEQSNPLRALAEFGQSPWLDSLSRKLIDSGELRRLVDEDGLKGITSNPAIFDKAVSQGSDYDAVLKKIPGLGSLSPAAAFELAAVSDIKDAADILHPVYRDSRGKDGFVSLEVSPLLAREPERTFQETVRLFKELNRSNVFIKIPGTSECLTAIEKALAEGVNINITLLFSVDRYKSVAEAYLSALEYRRRKGLSIDNVASVASFFVSRIDTAADPLIKEAKFKGRVAIANAKKAYEHFKELSASRRFKELEKAGAKPQRLLWASTSTKNPAYRDVLYIEELIGPETINTMPPETWKAFKDHGRPRASLEENVQGARAVLDGLEKSGVHLARICKELEDKGIKAFAESYAHLLKGLEEKMKVLA